jgi:catechol 2,3-dioxygenase-like lactoylglutathione lyase family enzyme
MSVIKVDFVGMRTSRLNETVAMFRDLLGLPVVRQTDRLVGFRLGDDTVLELYHPTDEFHSFSVTGPVVAFQVEGFEETRRTMIAAGTRFIGEPQYADGVGWQHFNCPDGTILEISGPASDAAT